MTRNTPSTLTPKRRFPEFRDAPGWDEKSLASVCEVNPSNDGLPVSFFYIDLESVEAGNLLSPKRIEQEGAPSRAQRLLRQSDIIYQTVRPYQRNNLFCDFAGKDDYVASTGYAQLRAKNNERFLYQLIHTDSFVNKVLEKCTGSNYPAINSSALAKVRFPFPPKPAEQRKIADCLGSLDDWIAAAGRELAALRDHKRGLMQQLFPQPGQSQPQQRFPEFRNAGKWDNTTLKGVCEMKAGDFVRASDIHEKQDKDIYPCYGGNGLRGYTKTFTHEGKYTLVGRQGALCGNVLSCEGQFHATEHALVVTPKKNIAPDWLYYTLYHLKLNQYAIGQAQPGLSVGVLETVTVDAPNDKAEQQKIAACLTALDTQIAAQAAQLDTLHQHKRGLMQQLFPSS